MNQYLELSPAYGRDYKSAKSLKEDWLAGKDFQIQDMGPDCGRYCSVSDVPAMKRAGVKALNIRFSQNRKVCVVNL